MTVQETNEFAVLLADARRGSEAALGKLLDRHRNYLWAIADRELGQSLTAKVAASDMVQETFVATYQEFEKFRGSSDAELKSWLRHVLLNRVTDVARMYRGSKKRDVSRELDLRTPLNGSGRSILSGLHGTDPTPSTKAMRQEQLTALQKALADLPPDQCEVVVRRSIQQESFEVIGQSLGRSSDAVRMVWQRAIRKLIEQLTFESV